MSSNPRVCPKCNGTGRLVSTIPKTCDACLGHPTLKNSCSRCGGTGTTNFYYLPCNHCTGRGYNTISGGS